MNDPTVDVRQVLRATGVLRPGVAVALACSSPATGVITWTTGSVGSHPVGPTTRLYAASVTKQLIGVLTAQQVLAGRLDPAQSVAAVLPGLPAWASPITVRHLLHHTSGLPATGRVLASLGLTDQRELSNRRVLEGLSGSAGPDRAPGLGFAYSNVGYVVLAEVLRAVTGAEVPALARRSLFDRLRLAECHLGDPPATTPSAARPPRTIGDGGWWTSATDLLTWLSALDADVFGAALTRLVQQPGHLDDGTPLSYAWGVNRRPDPAGPVYTHGGNWPGWSAKTVRQPARRIAVALLSTSDDVDAVSAAGLALHDRLAGDA